MAWTDDMTKTVEDLTKEIRRLRLALHDIDEVVDGEVDADDGRPNTAMRVSMIIKQALG